jgi:PAS domain S-box-containing protein
MPPLLDPLPRIPRAFFSNPNRLARYGSAAVITTLATVITYLLWSSLGSTISPLFFVGVIFVSWYGGLRPGLLSAILSAAACTFVFAATPGQLLLGADDLLRLVAFMIGAIFVSSLTMARHHAELAALDAEKQLTITLKSIGDAVITTDASGRITFMNSIAQSLTGWQQHEAHGREIDELVRIVDTKTRCEVETVVTRVLRDNVVLSLDGPVFMVARDGTELPIDQIATPMRDSQGRINGIVLVLRSVPDPKPKDPERALTETIKLLEAVDANLLAVDLKGYCAFASTSAAQLLGYQSYELTGKDIRELLPSSNDGDWAYAEEEWTESDGVKPDMGALLTTETLSRRDATQVPVELCRAPLIMGKEIVGTVVTITDLTERRRAQEAITRLESIADSVNEAIITHTADGIITSWNRAAEQIYGFLEEEVVGRHVSIIHPPAYKHELRKLFERVVQLERVDAFETVRIKKGGERVFVSINAVPLDDGSGTAVCVAQIVTDLTERKKAEEAALRATGEQAAMNRQLAAAVNRPRARAHATNAPAISQPVVEVRTLPEHGVSAILIGRSPLMKKLYATIERVAPSDSSILITGATGTGKELVARAIHEKSRRARGPFVDVNCSAIPETLIEAELFGHQRGTFTGAHENRPGLFEAASGGTIFLDEVDALPLAAQAKLLRVLQDKRVRRVGGRTNIAVDVRIISATNCDLSEAISAGRFRPDLFYRLRVFPIHTPELCHRLDDVELLIDYFLDRHADQQGVARRRFSPEGMTALLQYPWPGNVRELESAVGYALAIGLREELGIDDLPPEFSRQAQQTSAELKQILEGYRNDGAPLADIEKHYILSVLDKFEGNQVRAAAALGIDRSKLYRRLKQYGIKAVKFLQEEQRDGMQLLSTHSDEPNDSKGEGKIGLRHRAAVG